MKESGILGSYPANFHGPPVMEILDGKGKMKYTRLYDMVKHDYALQQANSGFARRSVKGIEWICTVMDE